MFLIELTAAVDSVGSLETFYVADGAFQTSPTDSPSNQWFDPSVTDPGKIGISAFSDGRTGGGTKLEVGEIRLVNVDGHLDEWVNYSWDGRPLVIRVGSSGVYPADFPTLFTGTIRSVEANTTEVVINVTDKAAIFDRPVLTTKYAGTNSGPTGLEGVATDLKGKVKPRVYGKVENIAPPCVNTSKLTYQVSDRPVSAIGAVYDRGAALTPSTNHANSGALTSATVTGGTYQTCFAEGLFRIGSAPAGQITADVTEKSSDVLMRPGQTLSQLATDAGLQSAEISASDIGEFNAAGPYVVGLYLDGEDTFRTAMDQVVQSAGGYYSPDPQGALRVGQLTGPSGTADAYTLEAEIMDGFQRLTADRQGIPVWRVTVRYRKFYTVQPDLAGSVSATRRADAAQEYRTVTVEDPSVKIQWSQAQEMIVDTLLTTEADALVEAARLLAIHKVRRDRFEVPIPVEPDNVPDTQLMKTQNITKNRFALDAGRNFLRLGVDLQLGGERPRVILSLWG